MATSNLFSQDMGTLGSAMTPQQTSVAPSPITAAAGLLQQAVPSPAYVQETRVQQAKDDQSTATGMVTGAYEKELSSIADAVKLGKSPEWAASQRRMVYNKYAAQFPAYSKDLVEANNSYMSDLGKTMNTGNDSYQLQKKTEEAAASAGLSVDRYVQYKNEQVTWAATNQANQEAQAVLTRQKTATDISKDQQSMAYARYDHNIKVQQQKDSKMLASTVSVLAASSQAKIKEVSDSNIPQEQKIQQINDIIVNTKANLASTFANAPSEQKSTAMNLVEDIGNTAIKMTDGTISSQVASNKLNTLSNGDLVSAMMSRPELRAAHTVVSAVGPQTAALFSGVIGKQVDAAGDLMSSLTSMYKNNNTSTQPTTKPAIPSNMLTDDHLPLSKTILKELPSMDEKAAGISKPEALGGLINTQLKSFNLYGGNGMYDEEDTNKFIQHMYTDMYDSLSKVGKIDMDQSTTAKSKEIFDKGFEPVYKQIQDLYRKGEVVNTSVSGGSQSAVNIAEPYIDSTGNMSFKVAKGQESNVEALKLVSNLNSKLNAPINNLAKLYAVLSGDPDLNKAQQVIAPYLFGAKDESTN